MNTLLAVSQLELGLVESPMLAEVNETHLWTYRVKGLKNNDAFSILFDSGASHSFTNCKEDFVTPLEPTDMEIGGFLGSTSQTNFVGMVEWKVHDEQGRTHVLRTQAYYVLDGYRQLFSPQ